MNLHISAANLADARDADSVVTLDSYARGPGFGFDDSTVSRFLVKPLD
jgi:hypothetical protein